MLLAKVFLMFLQNLFSSLVSPKMFLCQSQAPQHVGSRIAPHTARGLMQILPCASGRQGYQWFEIGSPTNHEILVAFRILSYHLPKKKVGNKLLIPPPLPSRFLLKTQNSQNSQNGIPFFELPGFISVGMLFSKWNLWFSAEGKKLTGESLSKTRQKPRIFVWWLLKLLEQIDPLISKMWFGMGKSADFLAPFKQFLCTSKGDLAPESSQNVSDLEWPRFLEEFAKVL